jgi:dipeptidyl aminopeptidase/acylaminoacyl peptidase
MGGSYGGYAALAGLAFTPEVFACGVDLVGPSNLETLLETIPPYWAPMIKIFHERMGDPSTPEGLEQLKAASPLYKADQITKPLLIAQGANDPRVKQSESDQIVEAMKAADIPVTYLLYPDEGHGFAKPVNNLAFYAITENFLSECLGGRAEPLGEVLKPSTAQIVEGAEHVAGLKGAITG